MPNLDKSQNSSNNKNINDPTNISIIYNNLKSLEVSCGNEHSLILSKDKNVYGIGNNEDGLLGQIDKELKTYSLLK